MIGTNERSKKPMNRKMMVKATLVQALFLLALGGWLLHLRVHPPMADEDNLVPFILGIISIFIVPLMFSYKKTLIPAYLLNGFSVIIGTIMMAHFSIVHYTGPVAFPGIILNTTMADIAILWGKFAVGKTIFDLEYLKTDADEVSLKRYFRYPNTGWWFVHLIGLSIVYVLGNIFWR